MATHELLFFTGMHHPHNAHFVPAACISRNALRKRKGPFRPPAAGWMLDSAGFKTIELHGGYLDAPYDYAVEALRWSRLVPGLRIVVCQDYMCEPFMLERTGLTVADHQRMTIERYDDLVFWWRELGEPCPIMPVLQGYAPAAYVAHLRAYGDRIAHGAWVGIGSVCKRQGDPAAIRAVLRAILQERPDLRLHGFGVKMTALKDQDIREMLYSADSMAWSFAARKQGRDANDPIEAVLFHNRVMALAA